MSPGSKTVIETRGEREIVIKRSFDAPAELVFDAWTRPEFVRRWWVPEAHGVEGVRFEADVRVGGSYRYVLRAPTGDAAGTWAEFAMSGRYIEVVRPSRLVHTEVFEPTAAGPEPDAQEAVVTVTFDEVRGRTNLVSRIVCSSKDYRDAYLANMEPATSAAMEKLADLLESQRSK
jgi:uncharacterized protein YndB with AHSA1/START domain